MSVASRRFKIAVFSYGLPCPGVKRSGIEQVAHDLANAWVDRGHEVTIFTYDPLPPGARYRVEPLPAAGFVLSRVGRAMSMGYLGNVFALAPDYRPFDVIVAHGDSLLLPLKRKPIVRIMHGSAFEEARTATSIPRVILQSGVWVQELATALTQRGTVGVSGNTSRFNPFVHRTIPNGVDLRRFRPDPALKSLEPSILFVGALNGRKRGAWLLDEFVRHVRTALPTAALHMVTTPGEPADGVTYHTGVEAGRLVELYQRAWVYASPSTYEGFGLPYAEALACGLPVVATANPGSREVLADGAYGRLVDDGQFAGTLIALLRDRTERERMAAIGAARAKEFDIEDVAARYEDVIGEVVARHG